jgi:hypothetical protein
MDGRLDSCSVGSRIVVGSATHFFGGCEQNGQIDELVDSRSN